MNDPKIRLSEIKKACHAYDAVYEAWPESKYEGESVYDWIVEQIEKHTIKIEES